MGIKISKGFSGKERDVVGSDCTRFPQFWLATTGRLHRVAGIDFIWRGPHACWHRPREVIHIECQSFYRPKVTGLTNETRGYELCIKCFPHGRKGITGMVRARVDGQPVIWV